TGPTRRITPSLRPPSSSSRTSASNSSPLHSANSPSPSSAGPDDEPDEFGLSVRVTLNRNAWTSSTWAGVLIGPPALRASAHRWNSLRSWLVPRCDARSWRHLQDAIGILADPQHQVLQRCRRGN